MTEAPSAERGSRRIPRLLRSLGRIAAALAACYAIALAALFHLHPWIVYRPTRVTAGALTGPGAGCEDLWLASGPGIRINAWFAPAARKNGATLLFFHGNAGNLADYLLRIMLYRGLGFDVLAIDYRGFGLSEGEPSEAALRQDASAAWDCLVRGRGVPPETIVILGFSLGGGVASWLAERHPEAAGLILESTFTSLADLASDLFPMFPARLILGRQYETLERLPGIRLPLLVIHSRRDELIGFPHGEALFAAHAGPKSFLEIHGDHNTGFLASAGKYREGIRSFAAGLGYAAAP